MSRPLVAEDAEAAVGLVHAYDRRWFGGPVLTLEDVRASWAVPGFDLPTDSEGWFEDGSDADPAAALDAAPDAEPDGGRHGALVAFGTLTSRGDLEVAVDPDWEAFGLEDALLGRWEMEARRRGLGAVHRELAAGDEAGLARLAARGWVVERTGWLLRLDATTPLEPGPLPDGYAIRAVTEDDLGEVHRVVADAFARYSPTRRPYADWRAAMVDRSDVHLEHWRVATHGDLVVGACLVQGPTAADGATGPGEGGADDLEAWVPELAVVEAHRRRGLAGALLVRTALAARRRGAGRLGLYTHEGTGALGLYERLGMRVVQTLRTCTLGL